MKKIGLLGGSFDPVHAAHIELGSSAKHQLYLDEVWVLIDKNPRYKQTETSYEHRLEMAKLATKPYSFFVVDALPMQQEGRTYGIKTLQEIKKFHPDSNFTLITGLDAISHFDKWENPEMFCEYLDFAIAGRPGHDMELIAAMKKRLGPTAQKFRYALLKLPELHISSTQIRKNLSAGSTSDEHLNPQVSKYVAENKLYRER